MTKTEPTLSAETGGTEITRFNALKHGVLSRYSVLPWEDAAEYHEAVRTGSIFPLPPLLLPRLCEPERERMGSRSKACEENQTAPRWRSGYSRAASEEAKGHVAAHF